MGAVILPGRTAAVDPSAATLEGDLVHRDVVRTDIGAVFAFGWEDDIPDPPHPLAVRPELGADGRQKEGA